MVTEEDCSQDDSTVLEEDPIDVLIAKLKDIAEELEDEDYQEAMLEAIELLEWHVEQNSRLLRELTSLKTESHKEDEVEAQ